MRVSNAKCMPLRRYAIVRSCGCGVIVYAPTASTPKRIEAAASKLTHEEGLPCIRHGGSFEHLTPHQPSGADGTIPMEHHGACGNKPISAELFEAVMRWREKRRGAA